MRYFQILDENELREIPGFTIQMQRFEGRSAVAYLFSASEIFLPGAEITVVDLNAQIFYCVSDRISSAGTYGHSEPPVVAPRKEAALAAIRKFLGSKPASIG